MQKTDKVNTDTSWNQLLMTFDVVSGTYHILEFMLKKSKIVMQVCVNQMLLLTLRRTIDKGIKMKN